MIDLRPEVTVVYVLERYVLHIFEATAIYLIAVAAFYWIMRKLGWRRMQGWWALIAPAVLAFIPISFREVFDVYNGDPIYKSFTDWSSWMVGFGLAIWGIYRLTPLFWEILCEIQGVSLHRVYVKAAEDIEKGEFVAYTSGGRVKPVKPWPDPPPKPAMTPKPLEWGCPRCGTISALAEHKKLLGDVVQCPNCKKTFIYHPGIWKRQ